MPELVSYSTPSPHPAPPLLAAPPADPPAPPEAPRRTLPARTSVKAWCDATEPPNAWKGLSTAYRAGAKARAAGGDRAACRYGREDLAAAWRSGFDGLDAFLAGGGVLLCEHCGRALEDEGAGADTAAVPPTVDPETWERFPAFRETFLMYVTPTGYAEAIRTTGEMLYSLMLEAPATWPGWAESSTRTEMRAAAADLRHLQGFLASVGRERQTSSLDPEDAYLSNVAARLARQIGHAAEGIERELAGVKP
jgi:hypothetical protein